MTTFQELAPLNPEEERSIGGYTLRGRVGSGGFKTVYLGVSESGNRAAVGILHGELARDDVYRRSFDLEIDAILLARGPFIARVTGHELGADQPWMVSEFVDGYSMTRARASCSFDDRTTVLLAAGWARALADIHAAGVIHRDFKPGNVLIHEGGSKVVDFGIAHLPHGDTTATLSRSGYPLGTPDYMSPEQALSEEITQASDVFSWAGTVCFAASGKPPFGSGLPTPALLYRVVYEEPAVSELPAELDDLVRGAFARDPADRPTTGEILSSLSSQTELTASQTASEAAEALSRNWNPPPDLFTTSYPLPEQSTLRPPPHEHTETGGTERTDAERSTGPAPHEPTGGTEQATRTPEKRRRRWLIVGGIVVVLLLAYLRSSLAESEKDVVSPESTPTTFEQLDPGETPPENVSLPPSDGQGTDTQADGGSSGETSLDGTDGDAVVPGQPENPGNSENCSDFATYDEAKDWFDTYFPHYGDVAELDEDGDSKPCEELLVGPPDGSVPACSKTDDVLRIGLIWPSVESDLTLANFHTLVKATVDEINSLGNINDSTLELVVVDEVRDLPEAVQTVDNLCDEQLSALVGPYYHSTARYVASVVPTWPAVVCNPISPIMFPSRSNAYQVTLLPDLRQTSERFAQYIWNNGISSIAIISGMEPDDLIEYLPIAYKNIGGSIHYNGPITENLFSSGSLEDVDAVVLHSQYHQDDLPDLTAVLIRLKEEGISTSTHAVYALGTLMASTLPDDLTSTFLGLQEFNVDIVGASTTYLRELIGERFDEANSYIYGGAQVVDCINLISLAAIQGGSNSPDSIEHNIVAVSKVGTECETFLVCRRLLDRKTIDINYQGFSSNLSLGEDGSLQAGNIYQITELRTNGWYKLPSINVGEFSSTGLGDEVNELLNGSPEACNFKQEGMTALRGANDVIAQLLPSLGSYMELGISSEEYLAISDRLLPEFEQRVDDLRDLEECLPSEIWFLFSDYVDTYSKRVEGYSLFANAIRLDSPEALERAYSMLLEATGESRELWCSMPEVLGEQLEIFCSG